MKIYRNRASQLFFEENKSINEIARIVSDEFNLDDSISSITRNIYNWTKDRGLYEACKEAGLNYDKVSHYWHKGKHFSINVKKNDDVSIDIERIISDCMSNYQPIKKIKHVTKCDMFDRLVWTDVHVGMDASRKGLALYPIDWNADMLFDRINEMSSFVMENKSSDTLIIDELGDFMDGWDGETTRKGHKLPQNMTNEEAFDIGLKAKLLLIELLSSEYKYIYCNNICEDNHAGSFGYVVNSAFKQIVDHKFNNVEVVNHQKFINHYIIGSHAFIITHGKDSRNLKFGFKPILDPRTSEKISQYIRHNSDLRFIENIEFSKGDSHQCLFDMCTSDEFDYFNYPAFSPSSEWVQTNFKKGRSGFVMQNISRSSSQKITKTYFFN
jgi:hypothetical protein